MAKYLTLVAVGDKISKKTELLCKYTSDVNLKRYKSYKVPRFQDGVYDIIVDYHPRTVYLIDTESDDDYGLLRKESYEKVRSVRQNNGPENEKRLFSPIANCVLLCYSVKEKSTFKSIYKKWCLEVRKYAPSVPIILIGTEIESRSNNNSSTISMEQGENLKLLIGAYSFVECSIEQFLGIDDVFIEAVRSTYYR